MKSMKSPSNGQVGGMLRTGTACAGVDNPKVSLVANGLRVCMGSVVHDGSVGGLPLP